MTGRRKLAIAAGAAAGLLLLIAVALPFVADVDRYRGLIEERAEGVLGREVRLGEMHLSFFPFGLRVDDVAIAALPAEGDGDMLTLEHLWVSARLLPLLSKRLEVTGIVLDGPDMSLERDADGRWNVEKLVDGGSPGSSGQPGTPAGGQLLVESLQLVGGRISIRDATFEDPLELLLSDLDLTLEDLALDRPLQIDLSATLSGGGDGDTGRISLSGNVGPLPAAGEPLPAALSLRMEEMPGSLLDRLTELLGIGARVDRVSLSMELAGSIPETFEVRGTLGLEEAKVRLAALDGTHAESTLDVEVGYDVAVREGGALVELREVELRVLHSKLGLRGTVRRADETTELDLSVGPSVIPADDLAALAALIVGDLPFSFTSPTPIEISLALRGSPTMPAGLELTGSVALADFTLRHPAMSAPLEQVAATVAFLGGSIEVGDLQAVVGSSDIAGSVVLHGSDPPQVSFDLSSRRADLGELVSLLAGMDSDREAAQPGRADEPAASSLVAEGTLRIEEGSFETLDFRALQTTLRWSGGVLSLDPLGAELYDGSFDGRVIVDLVPVEPTFEIRGEARQVALGAFLADNLEDGETLSGRFTGAVATSGSGADFESIVGSLKGKGSIEITGGRLGGLDVLATLSRVSGVFGENTVEQLSSRLAAEGTGFERMSGKLSLANGTMRFEELRLDSPDFRLDGSGRVELLSTQLDGDFRLILSAAISESMRAEKSKAGRVFWSSKSRRVELPFTLSGPLAEPSASIAYEKIARGALRAEVDEGVRKLLGDRLGLQPTGGTEPEPTAESGTFLAVEWRGSLLAPDLQIHGAVRIDGVKKAKLVVTDARGSELHSDRIDEVEKRIGSGKSGRYVGWRVKLDGEALLLARKPLTVRLIVTHEDGRVERVERTVDR